MRYYRIVDDCYWTHFVAVPDECDVLLAPHTRSAEEITKQEYDRRENMNHQRECREILAHYGNKKQEVQAVQELSELILLLVARPDQRGDDYRAHLIEEIADNEIMIEQVKAMHGITDCEVECEIKRKIERQMRRIEAET